MARPEFCFAVQHGGTGYCGDPRLPRPALSLFPEIQAGGMVEQITQGVRIRAYAVHCPEQISEHGHSFTFMCEAPCSVTSSIELTHWCDAQ